MKLSKSDIETLRERLRNTDGGVRGAATEAGIAEPIAHKVLAGKSCREATLDAFIDGVGKLEAREAKSRAERSARVKAPVSAV